MTQRPLGRLIIILTITLLGLFLLFGSCSSSQPAALRSTQLRLQDMQRDPFIQEYASDEIAEAKRAMDYAELRWEEVQDPEEVVVLSRQTERLLDDALIIAEERASAKNGAQRARLRLQETSDTREGVSTAQGANKTHLEHSAAGLSAILRQQASRPQKEIYLSLRSDLLFEHNGQTLNEETTPSLAPILSYLQTHPEQHVRIEAHTDSTDDVMFNKQLSAGRARALSNHLVQHGIPRARIHHEGLGEEYPVASNSTSSGRLRNRRIDFFIFTPTQ
jgi:OOP family OmpA-OmpF porin